MTRLLIAIGLLVLVITTATFSQEAPASETLRLSYNPTYDLWFFIPSGRPENIGQNVKDAYKKQTPGGVCYQPIDDWFYCSSGERIINF